MHVNFHENYHLEMLHMQCITKYPAHAIAPFLLACYFQTHSNLLVDAPKSFRLRQHAQIFSYLRIYEHSIMKLIRSALSYLKKQSILDYAILNKRPNHYQLKQFQACTVCHVLFRFLQVFLGISIAMHFLIHFFQMNEVLTILKILLT